MKVILVLYTCRRKITVIELLEVISNMEQTKQKLSEFLVGGYGKPSKVSSSSNKIINIVLAYIE
jgi:hypothetical protein